MKLSKRKLQRIIREETRKVLSEDSTGVDMGRVLQLIKEEGERFLRIEDLRGRVTVSQRHNVVDVEDSNLEYPITITAEESRRGGVLVEVGSEISVNYGRGSGLEKISYRDPEDIVNSRKLLDAITDHHIIIDEFEESRRY
jgi:hypothetical protein